MSPQFPIEDPSESASLGQRTLDYVRQYPLLRVVLVVNLIDYAGAALLILTGHLSAGAGGVAVLLSVFTWFFAVALPVMNRELRASLGAARTGYWSDLVEMFGRVVLCAVTLLFTAMLVYALFA